MPSQPIATSSDTQSEALRSALWTSAKIAPWIVFGPITGVMSGWAIHYFRSGRPLLGIGCLIGNVGLVLSIPALTAIVLRFR